MVLYLRANKIEWKVPVLPLYKQFPSNCPSSRSLESIALQVDNCIQRFSEESISTMENVSFHHSLLAPGEDSYSTVLKCWEF